MPELPEVETTLRGITPFVTNATITGVEVRNPSLRWPVPVEQMQELLGQPIISGYRRAKYILLNTANTTLMIHLGMSGSLRVLDPETPAGKHDHIDLSLNGSKILRYNDPRRFGSWLLIDGSVDSHPLLSHLGPEPLSDAFNGEHLFRLSRKRKVAVKNFIMDGKIVVGVGNIYASEALFMAGVRPGRQATRVTRREYDNLADRIKFVLQRSIDMGGTTLRDFTRADGQAGYFKQKLQVYDRFAEPCRVCQTPIKKVTIGQRSSFYCPSCQS